MINNDSLIILDSILNIIIINNDYFIIDGNFNDEILHYFNCNRWFKPLGD